MKTHETPDPPGRLEKATSLLVKAAYATIEAKYGPEGTNPKPYHNVMHTRDVVEALSELADLALSRGKITDRDKALLLIAGAFHDTEHDFKSGQNEAASADIAAAAMRNETLFTLSDQNKVQAMIMATEVQLIDGYPVQLVPDNNFFAGLMADADLSSLGRPTSFFRDRSYAMFREMFGDNASATDRYAFLRIEERLLSQHQFFTPEARELFPHQAENLADIRASLQTEKY